MVAYKLLLLSLLTAPVAARLSWVDFANFPAFRDLDTCAGQCLYCNGSITCIDARVSVDLYLGCLWDACICGAASNEKRAVEYLQSCVPSSCPSSSGIAIQVMHQYCNLSTANTSTQVGNDSIWNWIQTPTITTQPGPSISSPTSDPTSDPTSNPTSNPTPPSTFPLHPVVAGVTFSSIGVSVLVWLLNIAFCIYRLRLGEKSPNGWVSWILNLPKSEERICGA